MRRSYDDPRREAAISAALNPAEDAPGSVVIESGIRIHCSLPSVRMEAIANCLGLGQSTIVLSQTKGLLLRAPYRHPSALHFHSNRAVLNSHAARPFFQVRIIGSGTCTYAIGRCVYHSSFLVLGSFFYVV